MHSNALYRQVDDADEGGAKDKGGDGSLVDEYFKEAEVGVYACTDG